MQRLTARTEFSKEMHRIDGLQTIDIENPRKVPSCTFNLEDMHRNVIWWLVTDHLLCSSLFVSYQCWHDLWTSDTVNPYLVLCLSSIYLAVPSHSFSHSISKLLARSTLYISNPYQKGLSSAKISSADCAWNVTQNCKTQMK